MKNHFLIVDDNALVCGATALLVEHITGCHAECCESGRDALRVFKKAAGTFVCVVTDLEMPGMSGLELGGRLRAFAPELKLLLVTGNPGALDQAGLRGHGIDCVLAKPFDLETMRAALRRILPPLNNSPASRTHNLNGDGVSYFERPHGFNRAAI